MVNQGTEAYLAAIYIYPVKSLDGVSLPEVTFLESGALKHDRELAFFDENGKFINGKRNSKIYQLRASFDIKLQLVFLQIQGTNHQTRFYLEEEKNELEAWLSNYFGFLVHLKQNTIMGFPDDTQASGPTIISTGTIETITSWFPNLSVEETRRRLRANLEINGVPPFWEDQLFAEANQSVKFQIGEVLFHGINPCQRCIVPTKDSQTGEVTPNFQKHFINKRQETLSSWTNPNRFNHFYRVSVNTKVPASEKGKILQVGDGVKIIGIE